MKVTFYGTRGSVPIANPDSIKTGGNTTCVRIESPCLPPNLLLAIDAGTGFIPLSAQALKEGTKEAHILFTHYHHDHTQGLPLSGITFNKEIPVTCWGPVESDCGPREVLEAIMRSPFFPKDFSEVGSHFVSRRIENPNARVLVCHETGGIKMFSIEEFERGGGMVSFGQKGKYPNRECLVIRMHYSNHPERTISYRFEEYQSKKVFVFLTDHENQDVVSQEMRRHIAMADLLVMDAQYSRERYEKVTAGYGHGTPDFCVRTAIQMGVRKLGLTHHDPLSTDKDVEAILAEARNAYLAKIATHTEDYRRATGLLTVDGIVACRDYQSFDLINLPTY